MNLPHAKTLALMAATAAGVYVCYRLASPFFSALAWALALAVLFTPMQRWIEGKLNRPSLAAAASILLIGLIVVVPATFVVHHLVGQASQGAQLIEAKIRSGAWRRSIEAQPRLAPIADGVMRQIGLPGTMENLADWLSATAASFVKGSVFQLIGFCLTFYLLFFLLRDRREALLLLRTLSPLSEGEMDRMFARVNDTIYATVYGTLAVSSVQGLLGGLMFWILGIPAALLWGVVMGLLGVVPVLGAFLVWIPAAIFLALEGSWAKAAILAVWGVFVVGTVDNLLYPVLIGNRLKLHTILAFISLVGGLMILGPAGLILGPLALTITMVLLEIWRTRIQSAETSSL